MNATLCIYCSEHSANTREHVPSKLLLRKPYPANLWTVPACSMCNGSFSMDEEYFRNMVVGMFCHTTNSDSLFDGPISRSFDRRPHLEDVFFDSLGVQDGRPYVAIDQRRFARVAKKIITGLHYVEKRQTLSQSTDIQLHFSETAFAPKTPGVLASATFNNSFAPDFSYRFAEGAWQLVFYGSFQCVAQLAIKPEIAI